MSKTVLITGASSGLGRQTAKLFQAKGWNVVATMRNPNHETELTQLDRMFVTRLDVQEPASIDSAVGAALERFGTLDVLVNNAGYGAYGPLEATPIDSIRRQFEVNVLGLLATTRAVLPTFRTNRRGTIVNISSVGGRLAFPLGSLYHGTKFAVEGISEALQYELAAIGARVKVVEPGGMRTEFAGRSFELNNDTTMSEYQPLAQSLFDLLGPMLEQGSTPEAIAEIVYAAAIDSSDRLRFEAGPDAAAMLAQRRTTDDDAFYAGMKQQFGLA